MLNWKAFERAIEVGYRYTLDRLEKMPPGILSGNPPVAHGWGRST
jgi:hypothetical protein